MEEKAKGGTKGKFFRETEKYTLNSGKSGLSNLVLKNPHITKITTKSNSRTLELKYRIGFSRKFRSLFITNKTSLKTNFY
jgi:hypothetical protein